MFVNIVCSWWRFVAILCLVFLWAIWLFTITINKQYNTNQQQIKNSKVSLQPKQCFLRKNPKTNNSPSLSNGILFKKSSFIDLSKLILVYMIFHDKRLFFATYMNGQAQVFTDTLLWSLLFITKECQDRNRPVSIWQ